MTGIVAGIVLLVTLGVLLVASIRRIVISYREKSRVSIAAILGLVVVVLVIVCACMLVLVPIIGAEFGSIIDAPR